MAQNELQGKEARDSAERAARRASPWLERLARLGYVAKGVIYVVIGSLALREAAGAGGQTNDPSKTRGLGAALESLQQRPLGSYMLGAIAAGFLVHGVFMFAIARYRCIDPA